MNSELVTVHDASASSAGHMFSYSHTPPTATYEHSNITMMHIHLHTQVIHFLATAQ